MAKTPATDFVLRPFEGLPGEPDWVALREVVPAATATAKTIKEYGAREVQVVTMLPEGWAALHRPDGLVLLALQSLGASSDLSRDLAVALLEALGSEPGTSIDLGAPAGPGPRLQDVLDLTVGFEVTVHNNLNFWLDPATEVTEDLKTTLDNAAEAMVPTEKVSVVPGAYWCQMTHPFLRWARPEGEDELIAAISRLHAKRESGLAGGRFVGAFRSCGLLIPVWELPDGTTAKDIEEPLKELDVKLTAALAIDAPLNADERRARAGIVSRQVTLR